MKTINSEKPNPDLHFETQAASIQDHFNSLPKERRTELHNFVSKRLFPHETHKDTKYLKGSVLVMMPEKSSEKFSSEIRIFTGTTDFSLKNLYTSYSKRADYQLSVDFEMRSGVFDYLNGIHVSNEPVLSFFSSGDSAIVIAGKASVNDFCVGYQNKSFCVGLKFKMGDFFIHQSVLDLVKAKAAAKLRLGQEVENINYLFDSDLLVAACCAGYEPQLFR
jgi:hypothetical protein